MTTTQYLRAFARYWWVVVVCAVLGAFLPAVLSASNPGEFVSTTNVLVRGTRAAQPTPADASQLMLLAQQRMANYNNLANSSALPEAMMEASDTGLSVTQLAARVSSVVQGTSTQLQISVKDTNAKRAQRLADLAGTSMVTLINRLERQQTNATTMLLARIVSEASVPTPSGAAVWRNPVLGTAAGILVGLALAVGVSRLDPRVTHQDQFARLLGLRVLGVVPRRLGRRRGRQDAARATRTAAVKELRTAIFFLRQDDSQCLRVALTSPRPLSTLTPLARHLAGELGNTGASVLLVEADSTDEGQGDDWSSEALDYDVVRPDSQLHGGVDPFHSQEFAALLDGAADDYDFVLVNSPATSRGTDAAAIAARCDVTVLAVERGLREGQVRDAVRHLQGVDADLRGFVMLS